MSWQSLLQAVVLIVLLLAVPPLGRYMADVYGARADGTAPGDRVFGPIERFIYRVCGIDERREQRWNVYAISLLAFSLVSVLVLYVLHAAAGLAAVQPDRPGSCQPLGAFNAAISFVTNTNWQWYSGELTISHLTQMLGLTVQNFVSAAAGMAVVVGDHPRHHPHRLRREPRQLLGRPRPHASRASCCRCASCSPSC